MNDTEQTDPAFADEGARVEGARGEAGAAVGPGTLSIDELQKRVDSLEDQLLRAKAEQQNIQRRAGAERAEAVRYANAELMRAVIPILDDFDRAIGAGSGKGASGAEGEVLAGVKLVRENLLKALRAQGLEAIESVGRPFDPHLHEAMMQQPSEEHPPGTVLQELARGYRLWERTLRPAKVIVSRKAGAS